MKKKRIIVTSALPYANGPLHIGHISGAYLPADIYCRYQRLMGNDVVFICGSDEHGAAITLQAQKEGVSPKNIIDKFHSLNKKSFEEFGISFDIFDRTSSGHHHKNASEFFLKLEEKKVFTKQKSKQFYDEKYNQFLADRYIIGECPKCSSEAYGDQCEKCGSTLSPDELVNPISSLSKEKPILKETTHWYLPMKQHENWLNEWIEKGILNDEQVHDPKKWRKQVIGQCKSWLDNGLTKRAMTRDLNWGVKVPIKDAKNKVLYVWLDAPIGYISATKKWAKDKKRDWKEFWQDKDTDLIHFIGKDNIVFHCIIFPIILKLHGDFILPKNVPANEFLTLEGEKLSTSKGWAIWLHEYLEQFKNTQDSLRYSLCASAPESKDTDFTWRDFQARNNNELVAIFGNFINRVVVLTNKYWDGIVPSFNNFHEHDQQVLNHLSNSPNLIGEKINSFKFREAINELINIARIGNKYLADSEPWKIIKTDKERTKTIMFISLQITAYLSILSEPFMPFTSKKIKTILNISSNLWAFEETFILPPKHKINKPSHVFSKIEDEIIEKMITELKT